MEHISAVCVCLFMKWKVLFFVAYRLHCLLAPLFATALITIIHITGKVKAQSSSKGQCCSCSQLFSLMVRHMLPLPPQRLQCPQFTKRLFKVCLHFIRPFFLTAVKTKTKKKKRDQFRYMMLWCGPTSVPRLYGSRNTSCCLCFFDHMCNWFWFFSHFFWNSTTHIVYPKITKKLCDQTKRSSNN